MTDSADDILLHYGKKGMKWGVRKAYAERQQKQVDRLNRVSKGTATVKDKAQSGALGVTSFGKERVGKKAAKLQSHVDRVKAGERTTRDILKQYNMVRISDLTKGVGYRNG